MFSNSLCAQLTKKNNLVFIVWLGETKKHCKVFTRFQSFFFERDIKNKNVVKRGKQTV